jgi:hypothetical protein
VNEKKKKGNKNKILKKKALIKSNSFLSVDGARLGVATPGDTAFDFAQILLEPLDFHEKIVQLGLEPCHQQGLFFFKKKIKLNGYEN